MFRVDAYVPATRLNIDRWHDILHNIIYTIIILTDTACGTFLSFFWSLQTEFWADRFAKCLKMFHLTYFLYYNVLAL